MTRCPDSDGDGVGDVGGSERGAGTPDNLPSSCTSPLVVVGVLPSRWVDFAYGRGNLSVRPNVRIPRGDKKVNPRFRT